MGNEHIAVGEEFEPVDYAEMGRRELANTQQYAGAIAGYLGDGVYDYEDVISKGRRHHRVTVDKDAVEVVCTLTDEKGTGQSVIAARCGQEGVSLWDESEGVWILAEPGAEFDSYRKLSRAGRTISGVGRQVWEEQRRRAYDE